MTSAFSTLATLPSGALTAAMFPGATGRGVRVAVIDSGVTEEMSRLGTIAPGVSFDAAGVRGDDTCDRLGHGTAVAATIRAHAPDVTILPVKVFDRDLRATAQALVAAIDWAIASDVHLINLSLGTANPAHRMTLGEAVVRASRAGVGVVAAAEEDGTTWLPGSLPLAVGVAVDWTTSHERATVAVSQEGAVRRLRVRASGFPAPVSNAALADDPLKGVSFAVANATGLLCLHLSGARVS